MNDPRMEQENVGAWPWWRVAVWTLLALGALAVQGPGFYHAFRPARTVIVDFFQEWASARFYLDGLPIYTPQREAVPRYLGVPLDARRPFNEVNAHPPAAVLAALPFALLDYPDACLAWNLLSLAALLLAVALVVRELGLRFHSWALLPALAAALFCGPLQAQIFYAQLNAVLALLIVLAWVADRRGWAAWAGVALGTATALKLFPAFLFLYFVLRGRWVALVAGIATCAAWFLATAAVFGINAHWHYAFEIVPELHIFRDRWQNVSLPGLWFKLFAGTGKRGHTEPLLFNPLLARLAIALSVLVVIGLLVRPVRRAREDHAFALTLLATLLVSPVTWFHYFLLLVMPLFLWWASFPAGGARRGLFWVCVAVLWLNPEFTYALVMGAHAENWFRIRATPAQTLLVTSLQTYALVGLFLLARFGWKPSA